jgi:hypothetical protein
MPLKPNGRFQTSRGAKDALSRRGSQSSALPKVVLVLGSPDESGVKRREKGLAKAGNARVRRGRQMRPELVRSAISSACLWTCATRPSLPSSDCRPRRHPGRLEAWRGRHHRRLRQRRRGQDNLPSGLEVAEAVHPDRAAAEVSLVRWAKAFPRRAHHSLHRLKRPGAITSTAQR